MQYNIKSIEERNNKKSKIILIIRRILYIILIVLIYNIFLIAKSGLSEEGAKNIFGYMAYIITTDSMKPSINSGDVIIIEKREENKLKVGDIVTYKLNGEIITHRIIGFKGTGEDRRYITKGDNNNVLDIQEISYNSIEGVKLIKIPFLGAVIGFLKNKIYFLLLTVFIIIICIHNKKAIEKKIVRREKKKIEDQNFKSKINN